MQQARHRSMGRIEEIYDEDTDYISQTAYKAIQQPSHVSSRIELYNSGASSNVPHGISSQLSHHSSPSHYTANKTFSMP